MPSAAGESPLGLPLLTGAQAGAADEAAVAAGDSWDGLLTRAGAGLAAAVVDVLRARTGGVYGRRALVVAGKGDNGGDGWVCAARLRERGVAATVLAVHGAGVETSDHSRRARQRWLDTGGRVLEGPDAKVAAGGSADFDVVVDCVLGTGATGAPRDEAADAVRLVRSLGLPVVACDVPSGVDADTGAVADPELAVTAVVTATFGAAKRGLVLHPGAEHAGAVRVVDLGPHWSVESQWRELWHLTGDASATPRAWSEHDDKRSRGRVLVLAGSRRYGGAAALCGAAALRTGAGLVTVATSGDTGAVLRQDPGLMVLGLEAADDDVGGPAEAAVDTLVEAVAGVDAVVVGPGLGHEPTTRTVVDAVLDAVADQDRTMAAVVDADGLNVFRHDAASLARDGIAHLVLTPHERELARLLDRDPDGLDRAAAAEELVRATGATVVAKGPTTLVLHRRREHVHVDVVAAGGPALGTGGTGDVLAGMLGATQARRAVAGAAHGVSPAPAGTVHLHALAGRHAGARAAGRATATDVLAALPAVLAELAERHRPLRAPQRWQP